MHEAVLIILINTNKGSEMTGSYNFVLVGLSFLVAVVASMAALDLARRVA